MLKVGQWVLITWYDACSDMDTRWTDRLVAKTLKPLKVKTAGMVIRVSDTDVVLTMNHIKANQHVAHNFCIPMAWIEKVKVID